MPVAAARLRFLYVGSSDVGRDLDLHAKQLGGRVLWDHTMGPARVAAVAPALGGPSILLASHRAPGSCMLLFEVPRLKDGEAALVAAGFKPEGKGFEIPNGPCRLWRSPGGLEVGLFEDVRPGALLE